MYIKMNFRFLSYLFYLRSDLEISTFWSRGNTIFILDIFSKYVAHVRRYKKITDLRQTPFNVIYRIALKVAPIGIGFETGYYRRLSIQVKFTFVRRSGKKLKFLY